MNALEKGCLGCGIPQNPTDFYPNGRSKSGLAYRCKKCSWLKKKEQIAKNPEPYKKAARRAQIKMNYGLTLEEWELMFDGQGRCCAICKSTTPYGPGWHTDHSHGTGAVRGILCFHCNRSYNDHVEEHFDSFIEYHNAHKSEVSH